MKCVKHFAYGVIKRENIFLYSLFGFQLYNFILILVSHHLQLYTIALKKNRWKVVDKCCKIDYDKCVKSDDEKK